MEQKTNQVRRMVATGDYKGALKIAKGFLLGITKDDSDAMRRGYEAMWNPAFYQSIGMNPVEVAQNGVNTVIRLYGIQS